MKALSTLRSAINQGSIVAILALLALSPAIYPEIAYAASSSLTEGEPALVFKIKDPSVLAPQNQTTLTYQEIIQTDPLQQKLQDYLNSKNSPLADYTTDLLKCSNWKTVLAISYVESNMGIHHYYFNSSGIGGQQYLRKYASYSEWINDMCNLISKRYEGWSFAKMDGVYVQPYSYNWKYGAEKIYGQLTDIEAQAQEARTAMQQKNFQLAMMTIPVEAGKQ